MSQPIGYVEQSLVEVNQSRSVEALSGNDENPADFTITLSDTIDLQAGDKVSLESSFISELGAGNTKIIQLDGKSLGVKKEFTYTKKNDPETDPTSNQETLSNYEQITEERDMFDNKVDIVLNYYKNMNLTGYVGLPRKFIAYRKSNISGTPPPSSLTGPEFPRTGGDQVNLAWGDIDNASNGYLSPVENSSFVIKGDTFLETFSKNVKLINDNSKYTVFVADYQAVAGKTQDGPISSADGAIPPINNWTVAPEYKKFHHYKELQTLEVTPGFNSAEFVAGELTRQLQQIEKTTELVFSLSDTGEQEFNLSCPNLPISRVIETPTYKTFPTANRLAFSKTEYDKSTGTTWYNNYATIAIKRPELYSTGEFINQNLIDGSNSTSFDRLNGGQTRDYYQFAVAELPERLDTYPLVLNTLYTKENLKYFKDFIDAQALYPEIWESFDPISSGKPPTYGGVGNTYNNENINVNNTRWMMMNQVNNGSTLEITEASIPFTQQSEQIVGGPYNIGSTQITVSYTNGSTWDPEQFYQIILNSPIPAFTADTKITSMTLESGGTVQRVNFDKPMIGQLVAGNDVVVNLTTDAQLTQWRKDSSGLGSSNYLPAVNGATPEKRISRLFFYQYHQEYKDTFFENPSTTEHSYGCFRPFNLSQDGETKKFVAIYPQQSDGQGGTLFKMPSGWFDNGFTFIEPYRKVGFDLHFTAPTTNAIALYNGTDTFPNYYGDQFTTAFYPLPYFSGSNTPTNPLPPARNGSQLSLKNDSFPKLVTLISSRYVGADAPEIRWDGEHFLFSQLHTPENLGNRSANGGNYANYISTGDGSGKPADLYDTQDLNDQAANIVYKINPREDINEFCPALMPYRGQSVTFTVNGSAGHQDGSAGLKFIIPTNTNMKPYEIYDSKSGIFLEDMGYDKENWNKGLWATMGFTYEQFNGISNNRVSRVDANNQTALKYPTTNSQIVATDTKSWVTNDDGKGILYTDNIPCPFALYLYDDAGGNFNGAPPDFPAPEAYQNFPPINVKTTSLDLVAQNFPTAMNRGYYTIRSDIIPDSLFVGGNSNITNMPIVGIVTKENPQNDFYFGTGNDIQFTIGKPTKMSSISVGIFDPSGKYARVNKGSAVIFKIQKQRNVSFNILQEILAEGNKKNKL